MSQPFEHDAEEARRLFFGQLHWDKETAGVHHPRRTQPAGQGQDSQRALARPGLLRHDEELVLSAAVQVARLVNIVHPPYGGPMSQPADVITANRFAIVIDGYEIAVFQELSGINSEVEQSEYWETSGDKIAVNKLPGKFKPPTVTLKRGMNGSLELWSWHEAARKGTMGAARRSCSLIMYNAEGKPVGKFWLENAWPSKLELAGLKAGASEALIETVTLTCEYIQRVAP
jgi:phage tail-like protein